MSLPQIVNRDEWLGARTALLEQEKELTRRRDALSADRRRLPMVEITKDYRFTGPQGEVGLIDLFEGRRQLILGHFMFDPDWEDGCPSCWPASTRCRAGLQEHLHTRDTTMAYVSRAPLEKLERWKAKKGWDVAWYSSGGSDFNYDFGVTIDDAKGSSSYNFRPIADEPRLAESEQPYRCRHEHLPARRRPRVPHLLVLRARRRADRRLVLLPRPHRARAPGGLGGAEGPRGQRARRPAGLRELAPLADRRREDRGRLERREVPGAVDQRRSAALKNTSRRSDQARGKSGSYSCQSTVVGMAIRCSGVVSASALATPPKPARYQPIEAVNAPGSP